MLGRPCGRRRKTMNIVLYYFSGTGNTEFACEKFKNYMELNNNHVNLYKIESEIFDIQNMNQADIVGIAYPIYGANIPTIINNFINTLPNNINRNVFIISTVGYIDAYGPFIIKKRLKQFGLNLRWHYVYKSIDNTAIRNVTKENLDNKHQKQIGLFTKFCKSIIRNTPYFNGIGPWILGGYIVRNLLRNNIISHYKSLFVDMDVCIKCNKCINNCPTKSINYIDNKYVFMETCTTCFRCINKCPENAIKQNA
jgi:ferredoxin